MFLAAMVALTESICWKVVNKTLIDGSGIGLVIYQKPVTSSCYEARKEDDPPLCDPKRQSNISWYACNIILTVLIFFTDFDIIFT